MSLRNSGLVIRYISLSAEKSLHVRNVRLIAVPPIVSEEIFALAQERLK
jgi:hypothetical protein